MWSRSLVALLVVGTLFGGAAAFLATSLNVSDPDVANILCANQASDVYRDHQWITQEGIRRNIREFFLAFPPASNPGLYLPEDATLSQLFHFYYGSTASPTRFIKAVNSIATSNINTDSSYKLRYNPELHSDAERLNNTHHKLSERFPQILSSILIQESYSGARSLLGTSLHSIQDFYSHSTWIEKGNIAILSGLGLPGHSLGTLAGPSEDVCTPCPSPQGSCSGNVKVSAGLSSGYYTYDTDIGKDELVPKPTTGGKCSHGGSQDESSLQPALGGINKDTPYSCFSPHHDLHKQAAELAVLATKHYLDQVLNAVGFDKYRRLFDLYLGSALSIVVDTTGSMGDDISAVISQVEEIVNNSSPEKYILSQFNDPDCGPVFETTDGAEFLMAVRNLTAFGGGDYPELFWCGLQLALAETPDYGDVFCFTDAVGKDGEKMPGIVSQAQRQNNKVTIILSDIIEDKKRKPKKQKKSKSVGKKKRPRTEKDLITTIDDFRRLTDATGGLLISASKFDVSDIVGIMGSGVETSTVMVAHQEGSGMTSVSFPVDDTIVDFQLRLSGELSAAILTDSGKTVYDVMNSTTLEVAGVELITYTTHFKALRWTGPLHGEWRLDASTLNNLTVTVLATSSLDFLASFSLLDATPPHPHYRPTEGQPLINMPYYLEVTLVGHLESKVAMVSGVQFIDKEGDVLREIDYVPPVKDQAYMWTSPLPDHPFYVRILGYLVSGNPWARQMPVEVWPVETLVELFSTTDDLSAPPGGRATAKFMVVNYGLESNFDITVTDDLNFLDTINPKRVFLANNQTALVEVSFQVPPTATHGQVSTVLVTARSQVQKLSYNTALTHFFVLPTLLDTDSPTCVLDHMPSCAGFTNNGLCSTKNWNVTATLQDHGSGLYLVTAVPDEHNMIVPNFPPGTTSEVYMQYQTDCCTTHVQIRGVDALGNVGDCDEINMGKLGGLIYYLEVEMAGNTWLAVRWNISNSSIPVSHYNLWLDGQFLHQIPCHEDSCADHINYLEPCTKHNFTVNPVFYYLGGTVEGMGRSTTGTTMEEVPETPISGREIDATETSVTIAWESANPDCSFKYEVCTHEVNTSPSTAVCHETFDTYTTIAGLEECRAYNSDVRALSHAYNTSSPLTFYSVTLCVDIP